MGSSAGKTRKPTNVPAPDADDAWGERQRDMFETDAFRPGGSGEGRRVPPARRPSEDPSRMAPMARPLRQELQPHARLQTVEHQGGRDLAEAGNVNPWLDDSIWPEENSETLLTRDPLSTRQPKPSVMAQPKPPPYQAVEPRVRSDSIVKPTSNLQPVAGPQAQMPKLPPPKPLQQQQSTEHVSKLEDIPEETHSRVDNDKPDFSNYEVASLLSPDHVMYIPNDPKKAPATVKSVHEKDDDDYIGANLKFYRNQVRFRPNGEFIDYIHRYWYKNYKVLEKCQTYIQWLFPISEYSIVNREAVPLRAHEAKHIYSDLETRNRFINSYKIMLDFYGFRMTNLKNGKIERKENWSERFYNLLKSPHNHARITRILKSLGELGLTQYQSPFVMALLHEVFETKHLHGIPRRTVMYWIRAINNQFERDYIYKLFYGHIVRSDAKKMITDKPNRGFTLDKNLTSNAVAVS